MKVTRIKAGRIRPEAVPEFRKSAPLLKELGKHAIPTTAHGAKRPVIRKQHPASPL
jgi:hypothetical protein